MSSPRQIAEKLASPQTNEDSKQQTSAPAPVAPLSNDAKTDPNALENSIILKIDTKKDGWEWVPGMDERLSFFSNQEEDANKSIEKPLFLFHSIEKENEIKKLCDAIKNAIKKVEDKEDKIFETEEKKIRERIINTIADWLSQSYQNANRALQDHLVNANPSLQNEHSPYTRTQIPGISIKNYLRRIDKYCPVPVNIFIIMLVNIGRYLGANVNPRREIHPLNIHNLIAVSYLASLKTHSDILGVNAWFSIVAGIPLPEINHLECSFILNDIDLGNIYFPTKLDIESDSPNYSSDPNVQDYQAMLKTISDHEKTLKFDANGFTQNEIEFAKVAKEINEKIQNANQGPTNTVSFKK